MRKCDHAEVRKRSDQRALAKKSQYATGIPAAQLRKPKHSSKRKG